MTPNLATALKIFRAASDYATASGYRAEIEWQRQTSLYDFTETDLLRESAWVILCAGFRERIVRRIFDHISLCYCDWESALAIVETGPACKSAALASFRNEAKLEAILGVARLVHKVGFESFKTAIIRDPIRELSYLPFIGSVTVWHLAKNLGLNVSKPDRHMTRLSASLGFRDTAEFCNAIAEVIGEETKVVDLILWRYIADGVPSSMEIKM